MQRSSKSRQYRTALQSTCRAAVIRPCECCRQTVVNTRAHALGRSTRQQQQAVAIAGEYVVRQHAVRCQTAADGATRIAAKCLRQRNHARRQHQLRAHQRTRHDGLRHRDRYGVVTEAPQDRKKFSRGKAGTAVCLGAQEL